MPNKQKTFFYISAVVEKTDQIKTTSATTKSEATAKAFALLKECVMVSALFCVNDTMKYMKMTRKKPFWHLS